MPARNPSEQNVDVNSREKILTRETLSAWRERLRASGKRLVVTNGCFDLLHIGHVTYLESARKLGDMLLVGLNSDASVRQLKGAGRPVNDESDRAGVLAGLESVSAVCIFNEKTALKFLREVSPDVYAKGGDYTLDTLDQEERRAVEQAGGKVVVLPVVPGKSTTELLKKAAQPE